VAYRGNETIYAEVKGRTKSRPGAGLDTLYGQLLRRMPAEEVGDPNTRFAVVVPTGAEAAALRVPRRVRDLLRIDVYAVSDDGQVERVEQRTPEEMERLVELLRRLPGTSEVLDEAVAKGYRTSCIFRPELVLAGDEDLEAFKRVLDEAAVRATATD